MKAGDVKKFLDKVISADSRDDLKPQDFHINDNFILDAVNSYRNGDPSEHIEKLIDGFINTEKLTVERRCSVLKMVRAVLVTMSKPGINKEERDRARAFLTAYFI